MHPYLHSYLWRRKGEKNQVACDIQNQEQGERQRRAHPYHLVSVDAFVDINMLSMFFSVNLAWLPSPRKTSDT